ncbi:MAG: hypothetical protein HYX68_17500 [Planctomycetes bacterium]|nr:hypothetical protein [Planctomycetota bacterium]
MFSSMGPSKRLTREIDNHYHLQLVAANAAHIVEYQERAFRLQRESAAANLRALAGLASRQDTTNRILNDLVDGLDQLNWVQLPILQVNLRL